MVKRVVRFLALCLPVLLWIVGCQSSDKSFIPVTGKDAAAMPAVVEQARIHVLDYVVSSSRLTNIPKTGNWQLDEEQTEGEYHFSSGDWQMTVWMADAQDENERVIIRNKTEHAFWCGYVAPDGHVVDTAYTR